jgi:hypothetical protein
MQEGLAAVFGNGLSTACIVNMGAQVTSVVCIEVTTVFFLKISFISIQAVLSKYADSSIGPLVNYTTAYV